MTNEKRLIDANELLMDINNYFDNSPFPHPGTNWRRGFEFAAELILFAPTVDAVEVVHGRWLNSHAIAFTEECSQCGFCVPWDDYGMSHKYNYCPNCGADMRERKDK